MNADEDTGKQDDIDNSTNNEIGSELGSDNIYDIDTVLAMLSQDVESPYKCELDSVDDDGNYLIHIYEVVDNGDEVHTATLDWILLLILRLVTVKHFLVKHSISRIKDK